MNTKNHKQSVFEFIDGQTPSFTVVHNTSKERIEKDINVWYRSTMDYSQSSFINYLDKHVSYRAFKNSSEKNHPLPQ